MTTNENILAGTISNCCSAPHVAGADSSILNERAIGICSECHNPAEFFEDNTPCDGDDMSEFDDDKHGTIRASDEPEEDHFRDDVDADADALASAGFGTDEDYGCYGSEDW